MKIGYLCYSFFVEAGIAVQNPPIDDVARWNLLQWKAQRMRVARAFELFRSYSIEPILIKGLAAARFYPPSKLRQAIDIDLAVPRKDFETATQISESQNANGLIIDVHRELRHLDTLDWDDLFENSCLIEIDDTDVRVLRPEDSLRVLCVHWLNDGGASKDRLWDISYAIENRPSDFDWARFLGSVTERRRRWFVCTLGLARRFLGLDLDGTPVASEAYNIPRWIIKTVEREWSAKNRLWPMEASLNNPVKMAQQIAKRLRPNPIQATISMEGSFDARTRLFYRLGDVFSRIPSSYRRISGAIRARSK